MTDDGWQLVPKEPCIEMLAAFWRQKNRGTQEPGFLGVHTDDYSAYRAMLVAAPAPSEGHPMKMLMSAETLARKVATDPDLDCEAGRETEDEPMANPKNMIIFPPTFRYTTEKSLFLAGSIEMGRADPWQDKVMEILFPYFSIIYNPRRPIWDTAWLQSVGSPEFNVQVTWELEMIEKSTHVIVYLQPDTISPISLLELGILSQIKSGKVFVCCPDGYVRKGNVDIVCERYGIKLFDNLDETVAALKRV